MSKQYGIWRIATRRYEQTGFVNNPATDKPIAFPSFGDCELFIKSELGGSDNGKLTTKEL